MRPGLLESAGLGTVLLDEVHELSISAQAKLLRALQERKVRRVGGVSEVPFEARLISAAKPILARKAEVGEFLIDLFNRLYVFMIEIPPLRERPEDVPVLAEYFLSKVTKQLNKTMFFGRLALDELSHYPWPGNVRELENQVLRLAVSCPEGTVIGPNQLRQVQSLSRQEAGKRSGGLGQLKVRFEEQEKQSILEVLVRTQYNLRKSARELGISHTTLFSKVRKYRIEMK
jgi:transcriptional regulator with PAS, ATPase and Fis domain